MIDKITINAQSSIKIKEKKIIYFDPYKITNKVNDANLIFITHDHYDHLDMISINNIINDKTIIVAPKIVIQKLLSNKINNKMYEVEANKKYKILDYEIETIPSYNINKMYHPKENNYLGYIITINNKRIYIAGDTDITEENKNIKCDIAFVPIGGTYTMDYQEAAKLINIIKPEIVIPTHYNCVVGSLEDAIKFKNLLDKNINCILLIK